MTNAATYGALSSDEGRMEVVWRPDGPAQKLVLSWTEVGGPACREPDRVGLGTAEGARLVLHIPLSGIGASDGDGTRIVVNPIRPGRSSSRSV